MTRLRPLVSGPFTQSENIGNMFVRWQSRKRSRSEFGRGPDVRWSAILVEAIRINGKPRQRHTAYLGSITESAIAIVHQRRYFWDEVLDGLERLGIEHTKRIEAAIARKVPRLSREEHEASVRLVTNSYGLGPQKPFRGASV